MGTVFARENTTDGGLLGRNIKEQPFGTGTHPCESPRTAETKTVDLQGILARVDRVNVEGLVRTKDDIVQTTVKELFQATNFEEMIKTAHSVRSKLQSLGCFRNIAIHIDTSEGPGATPNGYEVTYQVHELKRINGGVTTHVANSEGVLVVNMALPNILGRGESLKGEYSYGSRRSRTFNLSLVKPFVNTTMYRDTVGSLSIFQNDAEFPMSGYKVIDRGLLADCSFTSFPKMKHNLQWEGNWRELGVGNRYASFEVRENSGDTLKSAIRHIVSLDKRDSCVFPTCGTLFRLSSEIAGLGGNVGFLKNEINFQGNWPLLFSKDLVLQMSFNGGIINFINDDYPPLVCDNFYLGGPNSLRGFDFRGVGPEADGNHVGGLHYWSSGIHLYSPLPFRPGSGGFGELFRLHLFLNAGNIGVFQYEDFNSMMDEQKESMRMAVGAGLAVRLGHMARVELNYCIPYWWSDTDTKCEGFQFGVGVNFI